MEESNSHIKLIVFDAGHVFIDFDWQEIRSRFAQLSGLSDQAIGQAFDHLTTLGYEHGRITTQEFLNKLNETLKTQISLAEFPDIWNADFVENEGVVALMQHLKKRFPLYLLSNTNEVHYEYLQKYSAYGHFEQSILSYKVGFAKPEPEIYHEVLRLSGLPAKQCLFIDDLSINVKAAEQIGMKAIHFRGVELLKKELQGFGVLS